MAEDSTNAQKQLFDGINEVTAIDDVTVEIGLDAPKGSLLSNLAWGDAVIVSPASADANATKPVGTGPFKFSHWVQGDRVELVKNPDYWGEPAKLDKVTFKFISDPTAAFAAMMAGDIDAFPNYPAPGEPRPVRGRPALPGDRRLDRGRDHPRDEQRPRAVRRHPRAPGDGARHRPPGDHRRRHVRLRHADRQPLRAAQPGLRRSDRALRLRPGEGEGAARRGRPRRRLQDDADAAAALLRPARRRDRRLAAARGRHRRRDRQRRMGAVAGAGLQEQGLRPDHRQPHRADGHRASTPAPTTTSATTTR